MAGQTFSTDFEFWTNAGMSMFAIDFNPELAIDHVFMSHGEIKAMTTSGDCLDFGPAPARTLESILNGLAILVEFNALGPVAEHGIRPQCSAIDTAQQ